MEYLHWLAILIHGGVSFLLIKGWNSYPPSQRRVLVLLCTVFALIYFIPVSYVANETTHSTNFCLRCHVMQPYGKALDMKSNELLATTHYQNNWVKKERVCYDCHADYVMFQDLSSKIRGLKHLYKNYISTPSNPIKLYNPYPNKNCLHCHENSKKYQESEHHHYKSKPLAEINAGRISCMTKGCHDVPHFYPYDPEGGP